MLDVKNAFNSASWSRIREAMVSKGICPALITLIEGYLEDRYLEVDGMLRKLTAGVPQGSVLGPLLWNLLYDDVLRIKMPKGVTTIADDLALVVVAGQERELVGSANEALRRVEEWLEKQKLQLAAEKTVAVMLSGRKKDGPVSFNLRGREIVPESRGK